MNEEYHHVLLQYHGLPETKRLVELNQIGCFCGGFPLELSFSEPVRPKFFKILRILLKYYHIIMTMGMY
jgi:hypothetical protein